jgi:chromosomal replication initiation ATPase DnaA
MTDTYRPLVADTDLSKAGLAIQLVAAGTGVAAPSIASRARLGPRVARARWMAMYLAHIAYGWTLERVGHAFGVNRATAANACRWVEDERDRRDVDDLLNRLERAVSELFAAPQCEIMA